MEKDLSAIKEEIRSRSDIVEVIGGYLHLQKAGKDYKGVCPFHPDTRPSLSVSPTLQIYKCYSCGEGGDVFKFVQKIDNLEFVEALEQLAKRAGIAFDRRALSPELQSKREQMRTVVTIAQDFFRERLRQNPDAQSYLQGRSIVEASISQWDIGYAPGQWDALSNYLERRHASLPVAAELGLLKQRPTGGYYDAYRNRITFPIHDLNGNIAGFGGRALSADDPAKYINSDSSLLFDKSSTLYGLYFARKSFSDTRPPVFVEGYLDVIAAHQGGFQQCIATLGTSLTEQHARLLSRFSHKVVLCYDADAAGTKAAVRGAQVWEELALENSEAQIASLPPGEDPDSLLASGETAAFQKCLDSAVSRVEFQLDQILKSHDLHSDEGRNRALTAAIAVLGTVSRHSLRARYADKIAFIHPLHGRFGLQRALEQILTDAEAASRATSNRWGRAVGYPLTEGQNGRPLRRPVPIPPTWEATNGEPTSAVTNERPNALLGAEKAEQQLLRALFSPKWRTTLLSLLTAEMLPSPEGKFLFQWAFETPANDDGGLSPASLITMLESKNEPVAARMVSLGTNEIKISKLVRELLQESSFYVSNDVLSRDAVNDCIARLQRHRDDNDLRRLSEKLRTADESDQRALLQQYSQKMRDLRGTTKPAPAQNGELA